MDLSDELRQAKEELNYWMRRDQAGDSSISQAQIKYFRDKIAALERQISETKYSASIPQDYISNVAQTMAIIVGRQLTADDIERINRHVVYVMGDNLKSTTQVQYQLLAAEIISDYKRYLYSTGIYQQYKVNSAGKIIS